MLSKKHDYFSDEDLPEQRHFGSFNDGWGSKHLRCKLDSKIWGGCYAIKRCPYGEDCQYQLDHGIDTDIYGIKKRESSKHKHPKHKYSKKKKHKGDVNDQSE